MNWHRSAPLPDEPDGPGAEVVAFPGHPPMPDVATPEPSGAAGGTGNAARPQRVHGAVERVAARPLLPAGGRVVARARWWTVALGRVAAWFLIHPWVIFAELRPILAGLGAAGNRWANWVRATEQAEHVRQGIGDVRVKGGEANERRRDGRAKLSALGFAVVAAGVAYLVLTQRWMALVALGAVVLAVFDAVGRKVMRPRAAVTSTLPRSPLHDGTPIGMIIKWIEDALTLRGHVPTIGEARPVDQGISLKLHSTMEVTDEDLEALERTLGVFPGAVSRIQDRENSAKGELRIMYSDPLDRLVLPERYTPLSQTVTRPAFMGVGWTGQDLMLSFLRTNMIIVAGPGGAKTSAGHTMMDVLSACDDVVIDVIDLSGGPFGDSWGDVVRRFATTEREAEDILRESIDRARRRTRQIAGRSRPSAAGVPSGEENWNPRTDGGAQHVIFIDELPTFVPNPTLRELLGEHQRIGRKAAENSIVMTQDSSGDTIKLTSLRKYPSTILMGPCAREDVIGLLGGGALKAGWRPDRLVAAEGDDANDAGKFYVRSGQFRTPTPWRLAYLSSLTEIHSRAHDRIKAGRPSLDYGPGETAVIDAIEVVPVPPVLAALDRAFVAAGNPDRLPTQVVSDALAAAGFPHNSGKALAATLREVHVAPRETRWYHDDRYVRGYWRADVDAALERFG